MAVVRKNLLFAIFFQSNVPHFIVLGFFNLIKNRTNFFLKFVAKLFIAWKTEFLHATMFS